MLLLMSNFEPWAAYPSVSVDRLSVVAAIFRRVWHEAVQLHDPEAGDTTWSLGCRVYSRICHELRQAAAKHDWLTIVPESDNLAFTFAIGAVPFKFYRGSPEDPPSRFLAMTYGELRHQQLAFDIEGVRPLDAILRIAVETFPDGEVSAVSVVEMDTAGSVTGTYCIPMDFELSNVTPMKAKPVELPAPNLEPIEHEQQKENDDHGRTSALPSVLG